MGDFRFTRLTELRSVGEALGFEWGMLKLRERDEERGREKRIDTGIHR